MMKSWKEYVVGFLLFAALVAGLTVAWIKLNPEDQGYYQSAIQVQLPNNHFESTGPFTSKLKVRIHNKGRRDLSFLKMNLTNPGQLGITNGKMQQGVTEVVTMQNGIKAGGYFDYDWEWRDSGVKTDQYFRFEDELIELKFAK